MSIIPPLTVSALAGAIEGLLREAFPYVVVQGEVGKATLHSNGHFYFDVKDDKALINCVMWRTMVARAGKLPQTGDKVNIHGEVTTYKPRSNYQIQVTKIEPVGLGTLLQQVEELKQKLQAEGLFDTSRKKPLPFLPRRIGIITSPTGAVIQDMLHRITERCPRDVTLWPVTVQGPNAAKDVIKALTGFQNLPPAERPDVIIVARGGGAPEELMPFNDEALVRAVAACTIPVISAIGHEPDFTLIDFVADHRAPTPTAAAERVVPVREELLMMLDATRRNLRRHLTVAIADYRTRLTALVRVIPTPDRLMAEARQRMDDLSTRLHRIGTDRILRAHDRLLTLERVLAAHSPMAPLARGFSLVRDANGQLVRSAQAPAGEIHLQFHDGTRKGVLS